MRFFLTLVVLLVAVDCFAAGCNSPAMTIFGTSGTGETAYAGYPTTAGSPDSPEGSAGYYSLSGNYAIGRKWTATENGTANAIRQYVQASLSSNTTYTWLCLYNGTTLVGYSADITGASVGAWTGYVEITAASGQSLDFTTGDVLTFGPSFMGATAPNLFGKDIGDSTSLINYSTVTSASVPQTTVTFTQSSTNHGFMSILRYTK